MGCVYSVFEGISDEKNKKCPCCWENVNYFGMLTGDDIQKNGIIKDEDGKVVEDYKAKKISSYDLHVGNKWYVWDDKGKWSVYSNQCNTNESIECGIEYSQTLKIPGFGSAIVELDEIVDTFTTFLKDGYLIAGRFDLKLRAIYNGLISQQATQVEPCYFGKLYCFLHNFSREEVEFASSDFLATIEFYNVNHIAKIDDRLSIADSVLNDVNDKYIKLSYTLEDICKLTKIENDAQYNINRWIQNNLKKGVGIRDIRWFREIKRLPKQCGLAPIYSTVNDGLKSNIEEYLNRSETINNLSERVETRIGEQFNIIKLVITLIAVFISFLGLNYLIQVQTELHYFSAELEVIKEQIASIDIENPDRIASSIDSMKEHTVTMRRTRNLTIVCSVAIIFFAIIYFPKMLKKNQEEIRNKKSERGFDCSGES